MAAQLAVVITAVARDFFTDEMGDNGLFCAVLQFYLGHHQTVVVAMKLIDFEGVVAALHEPAGLVDNARFAERQQPLGIVERNFLFELIARKTAVERGTLDGDIASLVSDADAHGAPTVAANITLADVTTGKSLVLVRVVKHEEFAFYL